MLIKKFCEEIFKYFNNPSRDVADGYEDVFDEKVFDLEDDDDLDEDVDDYDDDEFEAEEEDDDEDHFFFDACFWGDYDCINYFDDDEYVDDDLDDDYDYSDYDVDEEDPELELQLLKYEERTTRQAADEAYYGFMVQCSWRGLNSHDLRECQDDLYHAIIDEAS